MKNSRLILIFLCLSAVIILIFSVSYRKNPVPAQSKTEPQRIVSMAPNITEILFALGLGEKVVAVSNSCNYPANAADNRTIISYWNPNVENIIALKPDLVIGLAFARQKNVSDILRRLQLDVLTLNIEKIDDLFPAIQKIGDAANRSKKAEELNDRIKNQIELLGSKLNSVRKLKVLWVIQSQPIRIAGRNTFVNELMELAGGENAVGQTFQQYPPIAAEQLISCGAEVIIQSAMGKSKVEKQQKAAKVFWKKYPNIPAVKNNRIYVVDSDIVLRLGPRLPKGIEMLARYLHPDIFEK